MHIIPESTGFDHPVISIDNAGTGNDVYQVDALSLENGTYLFERTIVVDPDSAGRYKEDISINGSDPVNEDVGAAYIDTIPPEGSFAINNGATATNDTIVTLVIDGYDSSACGVMMMVSSNETFDGTVWQEFKQTLSWELIPEPGEQTVYMKFRDCAGNESEIVYDTISFIMPE
jgi:hypothetical protein